MLPRPLPYFSLHTPCASALRYYLRRHGHKYDTVKRVTLALREEYLQRVHAELYASIDTMLPSAPHAVTSVQALLVDAPAQQARPPRVLRPSDVLLIQEACSKVQDHRDNASAQTTDT